MQESAEHSSQTNTGNSEQLSRLRQALQRPVRGERERVGVACCWRATPRTLLLLLLRRRRLRRAGGGGGS